MPRLHRFYKELLPKDKCSFLFIGTFNPIWDVANGDNPAYFYSRSASEFWCILPHALYESCLVDKGRIEKEEFCNNHKIGFTDLIYCINNVVENKGSRFLKKGFKDEDFERLDEGKADLDITFFTDQIIQYIERNKESITAIFLTRKTSKDNPRIWNEWLTIKSFCLSVGITALELHSPSRREGEIRDKIFSWRKAIEAAFQMAGTKEND